MSHGLDNLMPRIAVIGLACWYALSALPGPAQSPDLTTAGSVAKPDVSASQPLTAGDQAGSVETSASPTDRSIEDALGIRSSQPPPSTPVPRLLSGPVPTEDPNNLASPQVIAWLRQLIRENLPESYEDTRKWNLQKEVWDGLDVSRDGLQIKTKRKHKLVNHGTWTRYQLKLVEPDKFLDIQFHKLELIDGSKIRFDVSAEMLLDIFGRLSQWVRDVQLVSLSANADAVCKLSMQGTVAFHLNPLHFPPEIQIKPVVEHARVDISYFRVRRISQLGGPLAEQLGNGLRRALEGKLEESNEKLAEKMNRQIEKKSDRMRFSTQEWLQSKLPIPAAP